MAWLIGGELFTERVSIEIDENNVDSNLTSKDFYIDLSGLSSTLFWALVKPNGGDIRLTLSDGITQIAMRLKNFNQGAETGFIVGKVPTISSGAGTTVIVSWGNATAEQPAASATHGSENSVDGNTEMMQDLEESGNGSVDEYVDVTANDNHGRGGSGTGSKVPDQVTGKVGNGQDFISANNDHIEIGDDLSLQITGPLTMTALVKRDTSKGGTILIKSDSVGTTGNTSYGLQLATSGAMYIIMYSVGSATFFLTTATINDTEWHHVCVTWDGTTGGGGNIKYYIDGALAETKNKTDALHSAFGYPVTLGAKAGGGNAPYDGLEDHIKLDSVERAAAWIKFESINLLTPLTSYTIGAYESASSFSGGAAWF